ncbi:16S rRNA (uracil(1498)-N(3))-methyltransferase [Fulvivirgaceae bacterium BMA12]|uniref:Ribosomal RNA small subunit methyltransferase E n=1 Tax=Agaribacillus aureus TaxID=3051825 RepID=A0ABT8L8T0_9BACT|nr:16S rRNA (uracil(1498)-N(3))-methyltransferase [Fulvivirgaceae bacterium BMA12]
MRLFYQPHIGSGADYLDLEESRHCVKVLRLKQGDPIRIIDGSGWLYSGQLTRVDARKCFFSVVEKHFEEPKDYHIHVAIAPTKNLDRLEWFVEKSVEIGIDRISPILCRQSERRTLKTDRLKRKAVSAMKQSLKFRMPEISELLPFERILSDTGNVEKFIAHVDDLPRPHLINAAKRGGQYLVLIGPEGDFSREEIDTAMSQGFEPVSLGDSRLRTETAGIAACHILNLINCSG